MRPLRFLQIALGTLSCFQPDRNSRGLHLWKTFGFPQARTLGLAVLGNSPHPELMTHIGDIESKIINLRTLNNNDTQAFAIRAGLADGSLILLSRDKAIETSFFTSLPEHDRALARTLAVGMGAHRAVLTGLSAARVRGMWVVGHTREPIELASKSIPPRSQWNPGTVYRYINLPPGDIIETHGVRTPRIFRILAEIGRHHGFSDALVAADWLRARGISKSQLDEQVALLGRFKGIQSVRMAVEHSVDCSDSPFEPYARAMFIEAGLPVRAQVPVCNGLYRVDLLIGDHTVVEIDGEVKYSGSYGPAADVIRAEKIRENRIRNTGRSLLRYSPADLMNRPRQVLEEVTADYRMQLRRRSA